MSTSENGSQLEARRTRRRQTPSRGDQQEQAILDATKQLLDEHRYGDLTVAKVASAAGISRPAVYFYFGSMDDLLVALISRELSDLIRSIEDIDIAPDATPRDVLTIGVEQTVIGFRTHVRVLQTANEHVHVPGVYEQWTLLLERGIDLYIALMNWTAELAARPAPIETDARRHAELCMLMVGHGLNELHRSPHDPSDEQRLASDLFLLVSRALELDQ